MSEKNENKTNKIKLYIPLILKPDNSVFDIGVAFNRDYAEWDLEQTWNRYDDERKNTFRKLIKEIELEL